jgi:hypothetical protein
MEPKWSFYSRSILNKSERTSTKPLNSTVTTIEIGIGVAILGGELAATECGGESAAGAAERAAEDVDKSLLKEGESVGEAFVRDVEGLAANGGEEATSRVKGGTS